ncbi:hypothetical protein [Leptospira mtsangambouensis]|uniref:hypothetical protein n=1 Tax=Leptospira mtsangambouensis TaxID=2484912 RepID=UPI001EEB09B1|nr:hypothetical protein [Leptospira mtsangambouensis]MCG6138958.1 hypothetical protein [Leptospira mtsangambouensis]
MNGYGIESYEMPYKNHDGSKRFEEYRGEFLDSNRHGKGILDRRTMDGDYYEGDFYNDRYHGYGIWTKLKTEPWPKEENENAPLRYEGEFFEGVPHGDGILTTRNGTEYIGKFRKGGVCYKGNCQNGYGEFIFWNGSHYKGDFKDGMESGKGTFYDSNNKLRYTGEFKEGRYWGYGVSVSYTSRIVDGKKVYYPHVRYEGMHEDGYEKGFGKKSGFGDDSGTIEGMWLHGSCTGPKCIKKK